MMLTEAELQENLRNLSLFSAAIDVLTEKMRGAKGQIWQELKQERDLAESRYIALYSQLYISGYRIRFSTSQQRLVALNVFRVPSLWVS